jgi:zinc transport system substrate-binding protein
MNLKGTGWKFISMLLLLHGLTTYVCAEALPVVVGIPPHAFLARAIGGELVSVQVLVQAGQNHETFEPTPRQLNEWGRARVFFTSGLPFEAVWVSRLKSNYPKLRIVDTAAGITRAPIETGWPNSLEDPANAFGLDPHVWLDPRNAQIQAGTIARVLMELDPVNRQKYAQGLAQVEKELGVLDQEVRALLSGVPNKIFLVYHPAWGYFARAYGWTQLAIEREGKEPGPRSLQELISRAKQLGIRQVFVQTGESPQRAGVVAQALGGEVVEANALPLDYGQELRRLAEKLSGKQP